MLTNEFRIAKVEKTLRWFEQDIPLLNLRVRELSKERQESARKFRAEMIARTRVELNRLLEQRTDDENASEVRSEPAD